jgi:hypothetical protein
MPQDFTVQPANIGGSFLRGRSRVKRLRQQEAQTQAAETGAKQAEINYQDAKTQRRQDPAVRSNGIRYS